MQTTRCSWQLLLSGTLTKIYGADTRILYTTAKRGNQRRKQTVWRRPLEHLNTLKRVGLLNNKYDHCKLSIHLLQTAVLYKCRCSKCITWPCTTNDWGRVQGGALGSFWSMVHACSWVSSWVIWYWKTYFLRLFTCCGEGYRNQVS